MKCVTITKNIELNLTADDWDMYVDGESRRNTIASALNREIAEAINSAANKVTAYDKCLDVLGQYQDHGAGDTDTIYILTLILNEFFGG